MSGKKKSKDPMAKATGAAVAAAHLLYHAACKVLGDRITLNGTKFPANDK
jgi:hypothetical protein